METKENVVKNEEFYKLLSKRIGVDVKTCEEVLRYAGDLIMELMAEDKTVHFLRFGKFVSTYRAPYQTKNPKNGQTIDVVDFYAPAFKPALTMKDYINEKKFPERYRPSNR